MQHDVHQPDTRLALLRRKEVEVKTKLCRSTIYAKLDPENASFDPAFPVPIRISVNSVRWIESEIDAYLGALPRTRMSTGSAAK